MGHAAFEVDGQIVWNIIMTIASVFGGWILKFIYDKIKQLDDDVRDLPKNYVSKVDYKDDLNRLENTIKDGFDKTSQTVGRIFDKLDAKADK